MARWRRPALLQQQPSASLARNSQPGRRGLVSLSPDIARVSLQSSKSAEEASDYLLPHSFGSELRLRASAGRDAMPGSRCALLPMPLNAKCLRLGGHTAWDWWNARLCCREG